LHNTASTDVLIGTAFEADERYQNAGEKQHTPSRPHGSATPTCQYAERARYVCPRAASPHPHHLARHGRAALVGLRSCGHTHLPGVDR
jgi:hypothetical protein